MNYLILFLKGFIVGIGKIIPGVSGSMLAVSMDVYEPALQHIDCFFKHPKESLQYLLPLGLGIFFAIFFFSSLILFLIQYHPLGTLSLFFGLLCGSIPSFLRKKALDVWHHFPNLILGVIFVFFLFSFHALPTFTITSSWSYLWVFFLGMVDALSMIVPGLSGTALFMMLGSYTYLLTLFSNPFQDFVALIVFLGGFGVSFYFLVKGLNYCFKHWANKTSLVLFSLLLSSLLLFLKEIPITFHWWALFEFLFFFSGGVLLVQFLPEE